MMWVKINFRIKSGASPEGARPARRGWTSVKVRALISIKRAERERTMETSTRERFRTSATIWQDVEDALSRMGFQREGKKCKKKWEVLMTDFRKVFDHDRLLGSGIVSYYMMTEGERATKRLPKHFSKEYFDLMVSWVPDARAVDPTGLNIMDSGALPESESAEGDIQAQTNVVDLSEDENYFHTQSKKRKTRRQVLDHEFKKNTEKFILYLETESQRRTVEAAASLDLEIKRHEWERAHTNLLMAQQDRMVDTLAGAMSSITTAMADFTEKMSTHFT
jgi:hypothetical protein